MASITSGASSDSRAPKSSAGDVSPSAGGESVVNDDISSGHVNTVGIHMPKDSKVLLRPFNAAEVPAEVLEFSAVSDPVAIRNICAQRVPGWSNLSPEALVISQVCEGLSNQIFKVSIPPISYDGSSSSPTSNRSTRPNTPYSCVLFRVYGKDANQFYSTDLELRIFRALSKYQIGPTLIANGEGWRIEEWHYAVTVPCRSLPNPSIFCQVASALGRFHKLHRRADFPDFPREPSTLFRLSDWATNASKVAFDIPKQQARLLELQVPKMVEEAAWLSRHIQEKSKANLTRGEGFDVVFCHNDVQENNLLQTQYGLRMIDFEYSHFNYQGYDIGNFFVEFTMDYTEKAYPFYSTDLSAYPSKQAQQLFAAVYLSEYLETPILPSDTKFIEPLLRNIKIFELASHLKWALWSIIRSPQAPTFDQFDFLLYAQFRFDCYVREKRELTKEEISSFPQGYAAAAVASVLAGLWYSKRK